MTADPVVERWRFTVDQYERMVELGIIDIDYQVELLDGEIVEMSPIGPPHSGTVNRINRLLVPRLGERAVVVVQNPLRLKPRSEPEPDFIIARDRADCYSTAHPTAVETFFVIEVSDTSFRADLRVKVPIYARHGIPEVWVVDIEGNRVLVHTEPIDGSYRTVRTARPGESITPVALPELTVTVDEIFGL